MTTKPLRVALVGLSAKPTGYGWLNYIHLPYLRDRPDIQITAVLGRSKASAEAAIAANSLPSSVRAYGSPEELAQDQSVDMVIVSVPAPWHRNVIMPSLAAGKHLFVQWPVDVSYDASREIVELARAKGLRTAVDIQGRFTTIVRRVAQIVNSGRIGRVLSTSVIGGVSTGGADPERLGAKYSLNEGSGATILDIFLGHFLECLIHVLGPLKSVNGLIRTMRPTTDIIDDPTTAPDQVVVNSELVEGAVMSIHVHGGKSVGGGTQWRILGETGEIEISGLFLALNINLPVPWKIKIQDKNGVTEETIQEDKQGQPAVHRLWDAFLKGDQDSWPDFDHALAVQEVIEAIRKSNSEKRTVEL
ncbi:hypothetical protein N7486_005806 [Penicillium sp. IBT 16267x]|nr:hypothetical protein N7486_005806 [Penicillium sp. IBT 16267x]